MILNFPVDEANYAEYCLTCHAKGTARQEHRNGKKIFVCSACGAENERVLIIDPKIRWWTTSGQTYCHESAGILLVNPESKVLLFELTKFPYGHTAPAGHVDNNETPLQAITREAQEEVGVHLAAPELIVTTMIHGDSCRRGCDDHQWSLYAQHVPQSVADTIQVDSQEGSRPIWVGVEAASTLTLPYAMEFLFNNYKAAIIKAVQGTV